MATAIQKNGKYRARVNAGHKGVAEQIHLGTFDTKEEAEMVVRLWYEERERYKEWCEDHGLPY